LIADLELDINLNAKARVLGIEEVKVSWCANPHRYYLSFVPCADHIFNDPGKANTRPASNHNPLVPGSS
jgi:hypothetical protein